MSDEQGFVRALLANPADNTARMVYADWLEERADPRGAFLRLEVALHQTESKAQAVALCEELRQARNGLDPRWLALVDRPRTGWRIARRNSTATTYGKTRAAFIHNGSYYFVPIEVYADGAVNCWGYVDLSLFRDKLAQGWVVPRAEVGGTLSIHNLGQATVVAAEWDHTPDDIERSVHDIVRELNLPMEGLLDMRGSDTEIRNGIRYAKGPSGRAKPYRFAGTGDQVAGDELPVLEVVADGYRLRQWFLYADGLSQLGADGELVSPEAIAQMFERGRLTLSVPAGAWVTLDGLGRFQAGEGYWFIQPGERLREASDLLDQMQGGPGAIRRCRDAHEAYQQTPCEELRDALRVAYEAVPEHMRMYCGDMDSKDWPIRRILYSPQGQEEEAE